NEHFHCFGCAVHGDVIDFVMQREGCSFVEACERLAARGRPPSFAVSDAGPFRKPARRWDVIAPESAEARVLELAAQVFEESLWASSHAQEYLNTRGVLAELARKHHLGYADGRRLLRELHRPFGAEAESTRSVLETALELGLVRAA